ncbi:MAG: DUF1343 domain-containing protein [Crocinitomicaceae bacterium]|nr:DUF1343 domain-containing protein [Crocinitomicaceae bacterium]
MDDTLNIVKTIVIKEKRIVVGAEKVTEIIALLSGKTVGVVSNQSSLVGQVHLVDTLISSGVNVDRVFSPEHGFRGNADAGELVSNGIDKKTGLRIFSLYGKNKKPQDEQLKDLDVLVFDIQDVGVRFYTYISTLHYVMEACAENHIALIVLDRPNPNGHYIDGPILEKEQTSFVGMHPIPIVHGMTIAEYAKMINGEKWLKHGVTCDLTVVSCDNYTHDKVYSLPVPPSPNLRSDISIQLYPSLCLLEATTVTVGRGTDGPFERYGHPNFPETDFSFTPKSGPGSKNPKHKDVLCNGYNLNDSTYARMNQLDLSFVLNANKQLNGKLFVDRAKFFNLLAGNSTLLEQVELGMTEDEIRATWKDGLDQFSITRAKYLMYD